MEGAAPSPERRGLLGWMNLRPLEDSEGKPLLGAGTLLPRGAPPAAESLAGRFVDWLESPVHASTLCTFRVLYSVVMFMQFLKWRTLFEQFQVEGVRAHPSWQGEGPSEGGPCIAVRPEFWLRVGSGSTSC